MRAGLPLFRQPCVCFPASLVGHCSRLAWGGLVGFPDSCSSDWQLKKGTRGYTPVTVCLECRNSQVGTQCKHKSVLSGQTRTSRKPVSSRPARQLSETLFHKESWGCNSELECLCGVCKAEYNLQCSKSFGEGGLRLLAGEGGQAVCRAGCVPASWGAQVGLVQQ